MPARFGVLPWITHASYVFPDGAGRRLETRSALAPVCATTSVPCEPLRANRRAPGRGGCARPSVRGWCGSLFLSPRAPRLGGGRGGAAGAGKLPLFVRPGGPPEPFGELGRGDPAVVGELERLALLVGQPRERS